MIKLLCIVMVFFLSQNSYAQFNTSWTAQYQHTVQSGFSNEGRKIVEDNAGNIFMLADVTSDLDPQGLHGAATWYYMVLTKYSPNGAVLASLNLDVVNEMSSGYNYHSAFGLEVDASGNIFVGYTYYDQLTGYDVALGKYDNDLVRIWTNTYSTSGTDSGVEMKLHANGTLYAIVKSTDVLTTYSIIESVPASLPATLIYSYPPNGETLKGLALDGGIKVYVTGYRMKSARKIAYVGAINAATSTLAWESFYTDPSAVGDNEGNDITVGADGGIYTVGTSFVGGNYGDQVVVLKNFPGNPHFDFVAVLKGAVDNKGLLIDADEPGWVYIGSASLEAATIFRIPNDGNFTVPGVLDYYPLPSSQYNAVIGVTLNSMKISFNENIYITGGVMASGPSGNFSSFYLYRTRVVFGNALMRDGALPIEGDFDRNYEGIDLNLDYGKTDVYFLRNYWDDAHTTETVELLDLNAPSPLRKTDLSSSSGIQFFPNPTTDFVTVKSRSAIHSVELYGVLGNRVVFSGNESKELVLDLASLASGIYVCKLQTEAGESIQRLTINKN